MSDKCSFFFGGSHSPCCDQHDIDYSKDSKVSRYAADLRLRECVISKGFTNRAWAMWLGARLFGCIFYRGNK